MNETNPKVAFVIIGWNNKKLLKDCFDSIAMQTYPNITTIYVDNASSDRSVEWVKRNYPDILVIAQNSNTGFAKGNNIGIAAALEDDAVSYVGLLNTDARLNPEWTKHIVRFASLKPRGACFQGTTLDFFNHSVIDSTHIFISRNGQGTQGGWRHFLVHEPGPRKVFGVNAAACLISRDFIENQPFGNEFFDEAMYMYLEDVDIAARATIMGWDNYLVPFARAYHMGSVSSKNKSQNFSLYMTFRNNSALLYKNFSWRIIARMIPSLIKGDIDTLRTLWRIGRKNDIWPVVKGRVFGLLRLPLFIYKRSKMSRARNIDEDYLWQLMKEGY